MTAVVELSLALTAAGAPCAIAVPRAEAGRGTEVAVVPCRRWASPFGPLLRVPRPAGGPVVLHVHGIAALTPWSGSWPRRWPGPVVGTMHGTLDWRLRHPPRGLKALWHRRVDLPLLRRLDAIHVSRRSETEALAAVGIGPGRVTEIPWTLRDERPLQRAAAPVSPYVAAVGRLHPIKGLDRLLAAFALLARRHPTARLRIAGGGTDAEAAALLRVAARLGVAERVDVLGLLPREALRRLLSEASVLALPSLYENFGMVVLEALREGCPVVASRETEWAHLEEERAGAWVDFASPDAAARALERMLDPSAREAARPAARRLYEDRYAPARVVPRFRAWYEAVLRSWRTGAPA